MGALDSIKVKAAIVPVDSPSPVAYINIFEQGDIWIKVKGCDQCSIKGRKLCCNKCPFVLDSGCKIHMENEMSKPFVCVVSPYPNETLSFCSLEFECVNGSREGVVRKVCEPVPWLL